MNFKQNDGHKGRVGVVQGPPHQLSQSTWMASWEKVASRGNMSIEGEWSSYSGEKK